MGPVGGRGFGGSVKFADGKTSSANVPHLNVWGFDISAAEFLHRKNARLWCEQALRHSTRILRPRPRCSCGSLRDITALLQRTYGVPTTCMTERRYTVMHKVYAVAWRPKGLFRPKRFCRRVLSVPEHSHLSRKTLDTVGILVP